MLARSHQHGVLDGVNDDLRIDAFFLTQDFDGLIDASHFFLFSLVPDLLPLELEVGFVNLAERELDDLSGRRLKRDHAIYDTRQRAFPAALVLQGFVKHKFDLLSGKAFKIFW